MLRVSTMRIKRRSIHWVHSEAAHAAVLGDKTMTDRIRDFLRTRREDGPILVVDKSIVRDKL